MCKCCEFWKKGNPNKQKFKEKIFSKISVYTWRKEQRAIKGNQISTITSKAFNLNFCPECGRKLKEDK